MGTGFRQSRTPVPRLLLKLSPRSAYFKNRNGIPSTRTHEFLKERKPDFLQVNFSSFKKMIRPFLASKEDRSID